MRIPKLQGNDVRRENSIDPGAKIWCSKYECWKHVKVCQQCRLRHRCGEFKRYLIPPLFDDKE